MTVNESRQKFKTKTKVAAIYVDSAVPMQAFVLRLQAGHKSVNLTNCNKSQTLISDQHIFKSWLNCVFNFTRTLILLAILLTLSSLMLFQLKKGRSVNVDNYRSSLLPTRDQAKLLNRALTASIFRALFFLSLREVQFFLAILV